MKAINTVKHRKIVGSLLLVEQFLTEDKAGAERNAANAYCRELETKFNDYQQSLKELELLIRTYDALFNQVKMKFLGARFKELKKTMLSGKQDEIKLLIHGGYEI